MRTACGIVFMICLLVLSSECDNLVVFVVSKILALLVMYICGKMIEKTMTDEELNEEV